VVRAAMNGTPSALGAGSPTALPSAGPATPTRWGNAAAVRAVAWARGGEWPGITAAEDKAYRFYLPWALAMAAGRDLDGVDPVLAGQAAELGPAKAVLAWRGWDSDGFTSFARVTISNQLQTLARPQSPPTPAAQDADPIHRGTPPAVDTASSPSAPSSVGRHGKPSQSHPPASTYRAG